MKKNSLLLFFQSNKSESNVWKNNEQKLKKLKLVYVKLVNKIVVKMFKNSIYKNLASLISGVILATKFATNNKAKSFKSIKYALINNFTLLSVKLNNKFYSIKEIYNFSNLSYDKNVFFFYRVLEKNFKICCNFCKKY